MAGENDRNEIRDVLVALHLAAQEHMTQRERRKEPMNELHSPSVLIQALLGAAAEPESRSDTCRRPRMSASARRHAVQRVNTTRQPRITIEP